MANLSGTTSSGSNAWENYVVSNGQALTTNFLRVETDAILYDKAGNPNPKSENIIKAGTSITLTTLELVIVGKSKLASIKVNGVYHYINISKLAKPTTRPMVASTINFGLLENYQKNGTVTTAYKLNKPSSTERGETDFINTINSLIVSPIKLKIGGVGYDNVCGVNKVSGTPKADLVFVSLNGKTFIEVCWVSHKMGSKAQDFSQWSGISESNIATNDYTKQFKNKCVTAFPDRIPSGTSVYEKIPDDPKGTQLKGMAVFGVNYKVGSDERNSNNVDFVLQGTPSLRDGILTMSGGIHKNGDLPIGDFDPVLNIVYKGDRSDLGIGGARAAIYPIKGRRQDPIDVYIKELLLKGNV